MVETPVANAASQPEIPYARTLVALEHGDFEVIRRTVAALHRIAHGAAYQTQVDLDANEVARHRIANSAVFMGYDFHLTPAGPRLIEVNTNAGGALLNGLHTASLCDPVTLACLCSELIPVETMQAQSESLVKDANATLQKLPPDGWDDGKPVVREVRVGAAFMEIIDYARENEIDLIVIGTHGRSGLMHILMGSVAERIVRKAPCPVLTVKPEGHQFVMP